jgi:hypothetical protein
LAAAPQPHRDSEIKQPVGDNGPGPTTIGVCGSMLGTDPVGVKQPPKRPIEEAVGS